MIEIIKEFLDFEGKLTETDYNAQFVKIRNDQDSLRDSGEFTCKVGADPKYYQKNRYRDIIPYDKNRVQLHPLNKPDDYIPTEDEEEGYINASFVEYSPADAKYIAAQAPLPTTLNDWFHMIREHDVAVIVNLCKLVEMGRVKCERYWPEKVDEEQTFGDVKALLTSEEYFSEFCKRHIKLRYPDDFEKEVVQLNYYEWPDHGCPTVDTHILSMIEAFDKLHYMHPEKPVLVHCSAGCGRTGTIIAANIIRQLINGHNLTKKLRLDELVNNLRKQRVSMVQTPDQYQFLHKLVVHFCREKLKSLGEYSSETSDVVEEPVPDEAGDRKKEVQEDNDDEKKCVPLIPELKKNLEYPNEPVHKPLGRESPPLPWNESSAIVG
uniref:protein-tyrosine-phosphatase n=1 Tax=Syphacia muris TaxID=451379 RepID=A0A0N5AGQ7_9BILA